MGEERAQRACMVQAETHAQQDAWVLGALSRTHRNQHQLLDGKVDGDSLLVSHSIKDGILHV